MCAAAALCWCALQHQQTLWGPFTHAAIPIVFVRVARFCAALRGAARCPVRIATP